MTASPTTRLRSPRGLLRGISGKGLSAVLVWGASFIATRFALEAFTPFGLVATRLSAGCLLLGLTLRVTGMPLLPDRRDWPTCLLLGFVLTAHLAVQATGLLFTSAIHTGWIIGFIPAVTAVGAHLLRKQYVTRIGWWGTAIGTAGIVCVLLSKSPDFHRAPVGDLLQLVSCVTWAICTLAAVDAVKRSGALRITTAGMAVAAVITTVTSLVTGVRSGPLKPSALAAVLFLGPICSGVAYYLWFAAQRDVGPARAGALIYIEPFVALVTGMVLGGERAEFAALVGGLCVLAGVWLVAHGVRQPAVPVARPPPE